MSSLFRRSSADLAKIREHLLSLAHDQAAIRFSQASLQTTQLSLAATQSTILKTLSRLEARMSQHSDALDALTAAEAKLDADVTTETATLASLVAEVHDLKAQLATTPEDDTATIQALTAQLADLDARIVAAQAVAQGELPPANPTPPSEPPPST